MQGKVCVVTGSRAEFGLLTPLLKALQQEPSLELQLVATGMHLSPLYGNTREEIAKEGFTLQATIDNQLGDDSRSGIVRSLGQGVMVAAEVLPRLAPDLVVVLGDRYEILAVAQACLLLGIPLAHIAGGEVTEGAFDDAIRHSISKMAYWHFVCSEPYRQRVIQLGEDPQRVFNVGTPGLDGIQELLLSRPEFEASIDFGLGELNFLVTFHPETLDQRSPLEAFGQLLQALDRFPEAKILFTKPNADVEGSLIAQAIDGYVAAQPQRCRAYTSLGRVRYLNAIQHCQVTIGNSSSGLTEVPALLRPSVNIGDRQKGRLRARSVIDCQDSASAIEQAIRLALSEGFRPRVLHPEAPYGAGGSAQKMLQVLRSQVPQARKAFYDLKHLEAVR